MDIVKFIIFIIGKWRTSKNEHGRWVSYNFIFIYMNVFYINIVSIPLFKVSAWLIMYLDCKGWVTLLSSKNQREFKVDSRRLLRSMRRHNRKSITKRISRRGMRFAKVNGDCCWEVREHYHGGESRELWRAHTYYLPWSIRSIKLIACWATVYRMHQFDLYVLFYPCTILMYFQ